MYHAGVWLQRKQHKLPWPDATAQILSWPCPCHLQLSCPLPITRDIPRRSYIFNDAAFFVTEPCTAAAGSEQMFLVSSSLVGIESRSLHCCCALHVEQQHLLLMLLPLLGCTFIFSNPCWYCRRSRWIPAPSPAPNTAAPIRRCASNFPAQSFLASICAAPDCSAQNNRKSVVDSIAVLAEPCRAEPPPRVLSLAQPFSVSKCAVSIVPHRRIFILQSVVVYGVVPTERCRADPPPCIIFFLKCAPNDFSHRNICMSRRRWIAAA